MYINPVLFGVLATIGVEIVCLVAYSIYLSHKKKSEHTKQNLKKGSGESVRQC